MIRSSRERNRSCSPVSRLSFGRIAIPPSDQLGQRESCLPIRGNPQTEFASKLRPKSYNPAKSNTARRLFNLADQWLGNSSRPTGVHCELRANRRHHMPMRGELPPVSTRVYARRPSALENAWSQLAAAVCNNDVQAVVLFCVIGLL